MSNLPYIAFYPGKWLGRTARLSAVERGVFITLICEMYETMKPLPVDHRGLARLCGTTPKTLEKVLAVLLSDENKLVMTKAGIWNHRVQKEIDLAKKRSEISRKNSQKRWQKTKQKQRSGDATALQRQCYPEPEPEEKDKSFSKRAPAREKRGGFVFPRTTGDAAMAFIDRRGLTDDEEGIEGSGEGDGDTVPQLPNVATR